MRKLYQILIATVFVVTTPLTLYAPLANQPINNVVNMPSWFEQERMKRLQEQMLLAELAKIKAQTQLYDAETQHYLTPPYTPSAKPYPEINTPTTTLEQTKSTVITEKHWQVALNNKVFHGTLEVPVSTGRVDIATETLVVEVDKVSKYTEGIEQVLKYAQATGKTPVLALYIDGEKDGYELLQQADKPCKEKGVVLLLANCYVSVNDLIALVSVANSDSSKASESSSERQALRSVFSSILSSSSFCEGAKAYLENEGWEEVKVLGTQQLRIDEDDENSNTEEYLIVEKGAWTYILEPRTFANLASGIYLGQMSFTSCKIIDRDGDVVSFWTKDTK